MRSYILALAAAGVLGIGALLAHQIHDDSASAEAKQASAAPAHHPVT